MSSLKDVKVVLTADVEEVVSALQKAANVEAVIAIAGIPDSKGNILQADDLRKQADGKTLFWDEAAKSLLYKGPIPRKFPNS